MLNNRDIVYWGWPLCTRTTYKSLDLYDKIPSMIRLLQIGTPFFKAGFEIPFVEASFDMKIHKVALGCGFIGVVEGDNRLYMWGDNYAG